MKILNLFFLLTLSILSACAPQYWNTSNETLDSLMAHQKTVASKQLSKRNLELKETMRLWVGKNIGDFLLPNADRKEKVQIGDETYRYTYTYTGDANIVKVSNEARGIAFSHYYHELYLYTDAEGIITKTCYKIKQRTDYHK